MKIGGIIDISTKDIPHKSSMVIFTIGCNLECEFCQNKYLLYNGAGKTVEIDDLMRVSKKFFQPERLNFAIIGPFEDKKRFVKLLS